MRIPPPITRGELPTHQNWQLDNFLPIKNRSCNTEKNAVAPLSLLFGIKAVDH
jgi:hypothetical protein